MPVGRASKGVLLVGQEEECRGLAVRDVDGEDGSGRWIVEASGDEAARYGSVAAAYALWLLSHGIRSATSFTRHSDGDPGLQRCPDNRPSLQPQRQQR